MVPLFISDSFSDSDRLYIAQSLALIESVSCVDFVDWTERPEYFVHVKNDEPGCWANVGYLRDGRACARTYMKGQHLSFSTEKENL